MFSFLSNFLQKKSIDCFAPIALGDCRVTRRYLLERTGIEGDGTAIMLAIPYFTSASNDPRRNLSAYAVPRDYHLFFSMLYGELLPLLRERFPEHRFAGFADHSPIAEVEAAARAGLGIIGENRMLITERYSSYVFLGEIVTDAILPTQLHPIRSCEGCGACRAVCPASESGSCLSALTQKKGTLTPEEEETLLRYGSVWGCDLCAEVCPHTRRAMESGSILSPIPFFSEQTLPHLTLAALDAMDDAAFSARAYAWRGRETVRRNLLLNESNQGDRKCSI